MAVTFKDNKNYSTVKTSGSGIPVVEKLVGAVRTRVKPVAGDADCLNTPELPPHYGCTPTASTFSDCALPSSGQRPHEVLGQQIRAGSNSSIADIISEVEKRLSKTASAAVCGSKLRPVQNSEKLSGVSEKFIVEHSESGARYVFKTQHSLAGSGEAELFATALRQGAGWPSVDVAAKRVQVDGSSLTGYIKPFIDNEGELSTNPSEWTKQQRVVVLADAVWAEFLGNYDTKPQQYLKLGRSALNIDWDHALMDHARNPNAHEQPLSRFKRSNFAPPSQSLLYRAFVRGEIDLDFTIFSGALAQISSLSRQDIADAIVPFADSKFQGGRAYGPFENVDALIDNVVARQETLPSRFDALTKDLIQERKQSMSPDAPTRGHYGRRVQDAAVHGTQRIVDAPAYGKLYTVAQASRKVMRKLDRNDEPLGLASSIDENKVSERKPPPRLK